VLEVNGLIEADEALKAMVNPPDLNDKNLKTIYQFQRSPKYYQKHGLKYSEISKIPNSNKRKVAYE
jgi:hypothetical protein